MFKIRYGGHSIIKATYWSKEKNIGSTSLARLCLDVGTTGMSLDQLIDLTLSVYNQTLVVTMQVTVLLFVVYLLKVGKRP